VRADERLACQAAAAYPHSEILASYGERRLLSRATFAFQASVPSAKPTVARARNTMGERRLVSQTFASWNQIAGWLRRLERFERAG